MAIKVYGLVGSNATFRVCAALFEKDLNFELVPTQIFGVKEQKTPQFLARNPFGQIPVLEDDDFTLFESRAITKHIAEAYANQGTPLITKDLKKSAIQTVWSEVESQKFDPASSKLSYELVIKPMLGLTADEAIVSEFEPKLANVLDVYESRLTTSKYLGGDSFTLVDLNHLPNIHYLMLTKVKRLFEARPHVSAWVCDILSRPAWVKVASLSERDYARK